MFTILPIPTCVINSESVEYFSYDCCQLLCYVNILCMFECVHVASILSFTFKQVIKQQAPIETFTN